MNAVLFAVGWLLVVFAGVPAVLGLVNGGGQTSWILLIVAVVGLLLLVIRSRRLRAAKAYEAS